MSAYKRFNHIQFANAVILLAALKQMGYSVEVGKELTIAAYRHQQQVQMRVSRDQLKSCADLGFEWNGTAFVPVINDVDQNRALNQEWRERLQCTYAKVAVLRFLEQKGATVQSSAVGTDGRAIIHATVEV